MQIIQSCGSFSWGGLEMQTLKIATALAERGHAIMVLCPESSTLHKEAAAANMHIMPVLNGGRYALQNILSLKSLLHSHQIDVIHTHLSHDLWTLVPALQLTTNHTALVLTKRMGSSVSKKDPLHRLLYKRVDCIFAISRYIKQSVLTSTPVPEKKVHLLPNAISLDAYTPGKIKRHEIRKELGLNAHSIVIGMAARITPKKGYPKFLQAAQIIKQTCHAEVQFLTVGGASYGEKEYEDEIRRMVHTLGLVSDIKFLGFRKDIPRIMAAMDIFVFPSYKEAFGTILLEAMAMQLPVVASSGGGVPDIVLHNETGLLVPPRDAEQLAHRILQLIENRDLRIQLGLAGRQRVERYFNIENFLEVLEKHYSELAKSR